MIYYSDKSFVDLSIDNLVSFMKEDNSYSDDHIYYIKKCSYEMLQKVKLDYLSNYTLLDNNMLEVDKILIDYLFIDIEFNFYNC